MWKTKNEKTIDRLIDRYEVCAKQRDKALAELARLKAHPALVEYANKHYKQVGDR